MTTRRVLCSAFLILCANSLAFAADKTTFAGKWEVDKKKTTAQGAPEDLQQEIILDGSRLVIKSKYHEPKSNMYPLMWVGIMTYELPLSADGAEKVVQIGPYLHTSKTTIEGNRMTTDFTAKMEGGGVTGQWIRTLSDDAKQLQLQVITSSSDGRKMDQTLVFRRK